MGSGPYLGGGFGHFYAYAPLKIEYAIDRFAMETKRQLDVLNQRLAQHRYIAGDAYTVADIAIWPWYGALARGELYEAAEFLQVQEYTHVQRWAEELAQRPAVQRGIAVLVERMKIGNPDQEAREALFGRTQLQQGRRVDKRTRKPVRARRRGAKSSAIGA